MSDTKLQRKPYHIYNYSKVLPDTVHFMVRMEHPDRPEMAIYMCKMKKKRYDLYGR